MRTEAGGGAKTEPRSALPWARQHKVLAVVGTGTAAVADAEITRRAGAGAQEDGADGQGERSHHDDPGRSSRSIHECLPRRDAGSSPGSKGGRRRRCEAAEAAAY